MSGLVDPTTNVVASSVFTTANTDPRFESIPSSEPHGWPLGHTSKSWKDLLTRKMSVACSKAWIAVTGLIHVYQSNMTTK